MTHVQEFLVSDTGAMSLSNAGPLCFRTRQRISAQFLYLKPAVYSFAIDSVELGFEFDRTHLFLAITRTDLC